jgi:hypothetical protein
MASEDLKKNEQGQEKKRNILIVIIVILTLLNGYFAFNNFTEKRKNKVLEAKRIEMDSLYATATDELSVAAFSLDSLKGKNATLDSLIAVREQEIAEAKKKIESLLKKNQLTLADLNNVKKMVKDLYEENEKYLSNINQMNENYKVLSQLNDSLNVSLQIEMESNKKLLEEKKYLSRKAALGSLLKPETITGTGIKIGSDNKETLTNSAKKSDKLKICFDVPKNRVADAGQKEIFIRIVNPAGATISMGNQGSGTLTDAETGEPVQYTTSASFNYDKTKRNVCVYWQQNTAYSKGTYKLMFYQDNYFLTESSFVLK